jgi:hypothetical protein
MKLFLAILAIVTLTASSAEARHRHHHRAPMPAAQPAFPFFLFQAPRAAAPASVRHRRRHVHAPAPEKRTAALRCAICRPSGGLSSGLVPDLAAKVAEIVQACGSRVISGFRPGAVVAGTSRPSLHASGRAADLSGNAG